MVFHPLQDSSLQSKGQAMVGPACFQLFLEELAATRTWKWLTSHGLQLDLNTTSEGGTYRSG